MPKPEAKILLAEDDLSLGELLKNYLEMNSFEVDWYKNGIEAFKGFSKNKYNICLLDVMMPEMNGFELANEIKQINNHVPFLFLTAKSLREDVLTGYKCGADDYILKPFDSELLIFKLHAILKRASNLPQQEISEEFKIGKYILYTNIRSLKGPKGEHQLSPKETELLRLLCQYKNSVLPRELALKNIWGNDDYFNGRSMDVYITKIRKYLKEDPSIEIINLHGKGYRFVVI
jgi:two-component system OmpR family response regulator